MATPTTQTKRLCNFLVDLWVTFIIWMMAHYVYGLLGYRFQDEGTDLTWILAVPFYYVLTETIWGKTPAKFITKTKVVMLDGSKPKIKNIIFRTICRFIPFDAFSFLFSRPTRGWHDIISGTLVVDENSIEE